MPDWIEDFVTATNAVPSPKIYRLWSAITAVSGVLERKVFTKGSAGQIFPNLFTVLVGPPASGKTNAIRPTRELWSKITSLNLAPDNVTKAALIDSLSRALRTVINSTTDAYTFSSMVVPCSEFGVFFTHHDLEFLSVLNHIYDAPASYVEERISAGSREINKPYLVVLAGTQPDFLNTFLPDEAWGMGFTSRLIMVYADKAPPTDLFSYVSTDSKGLIKHLSQIFELKGEFIWSKNAIDEINAWNRSNCPPTPIHSKLLHYNGRRALHTIKLSMISAAARTGELHVHLEDFERAQSWILEAETTMPDIFSAMGQKSDSQVILDLHFNMWRQWSTITNEKRKPIEENYIYKFLGSKVPSDKIPKIIEAANKMGYIEKGLYPGTWIPRPTSSFGQM